MFFPAETAGEAALARPFFQGKKGGSVRAGGRGGEAVMGGRGRSIAAESGKALSACRGRGVLPQRGEAPAGASEKGKEERAGFPPQRAAEKGRDCRPACRDVRLCGRERKSPAGAGHSGMSSQGGKPQGGFPCISFRRLLPHRGWRRSRNRRPPVRWGLRVRRRACRPGSFRAVPCCFPWPA